MSKEDGRNFHEWFDGVYTFTQIDLHAGCKHVHVHKVQLPKYGQKGWYVSIGSLSAFAHNGDQEKHKGCWSPDYLYVCKRSYEFEDECQNLSSRWPDLDDRKLPVTEHASLWDFYKAVGYDYKRKKWLNTDAKAPKQKSLKSAKK